jgi:hypothetical protein
MSSKKIFAGKRTDSTPFLVACHSVPKHGGLSPQLVCLLFRTVFPPIRPVGLTNSLKEYWDLTDFTGLLSSPKFGLLDPISQCHGRAIAQGRDQVGENKEEGKTFLF